MTVIDIARGAGLTGCSTVARDAAAAVARAISRNHLKFRHSSRTVLCCRNLPDETDIAVGTVENITETQRQILIKFNGLALDSSPSADALAAVPAPENEVAENGILASMSESGMSSGWRRFAHSVPRCAVLRSRFTGTYLLQRVQ